MLRNIYYKKSPDARGSVLVMVAIGMVMLVGMVALAIDLGQLYLVRSELQTVADAAALAGAKKLLQPKSGTNLVEVFCDEAVTTAQNCASQNKSSGQPMTISTSDVVLGQWDVRTNSFLRTGCSTNPMEVNAVQVTVRRQGDTNPKITNFFAGIFGLGELSSSATATALLGVAGTSSLDIPFGVPANYPAGQQPYAQLKADPLSWVTPSPAYAADSLKYTWHDYGGSTLDTTRGAWIMPLESEKTDSTKLQKYIKGPNVTGGLRYPQVRVGDRVYPLSEYWYGSWNKTNFTLLQTRFNAEKDKATNRWRVTAAVYSTKQVTELAPPNPWLRLAGKLLPKGSEAFACTPYPYPSVYIQGFVTLDVTNVVLNTSCVTTDGSTQIDNTKSCRNTCYMEAVVPLTSNIVSNDKGSSPVPFQQDYKDMNTSASEVGVFSSVPRLVK